MTASQLAAIGRHVLTFLMGGITFLAAIHVLSAGDAATMGAALTKIGTDVADIAAALAPVVAIVSGWYAAYKSSHQQQIASVNAIPGIKVVGENAPGAQVSVAPKV